VLSRQLAADFGREVEMAAIVDKFNELFFGEKVDGRWNGFVSRERWAPRDGLLDRLSQRYDLAIFTGRPWVEAEVTLTRFASGVQFAEIVCDEDVSEHKPAPEGLLLIAGRHPGVGLTYVGDTVDDARSARAAGVPFIGVAPLSNPGHAESASLLKAEGAFAVIHDLNQIEGVLP
jgi:HAD superfamily phosphatase